MEFATKQASTTLNVAAKRQTHPFFFLVCYQQRTSYSSTITTDLVAAAEKQQQNGDGPLVHPVGCEQEKGGARIHIQVRVYNENKCAGTDISEWPTPPYTRSLPKNAGCTSLPLLGLAFVCFVPHLTRCWPTFSLNVFPFAGLYLTRTAR